MRGDSRILEQREGDENSGFMLRQDTITGQGDGDVVFGDVFLVPSKDLQFAFETIGSTVGSFLGTQLADGNKYQEIVYSTLFKTIGDNFGTFTAYLANDNNLSASLDAAMGGSIEGTAFEDPEFS